MKLVFLAVDGVVAPNWTYNVWRKAGCKSDFDAYVKLLDPTLVTLVDDFAKDVGASVVVSSSWRDPDTVAGHAVDSVLRAAGITVPIVGHTPFTTKNVLVHRGYDINAYLVANGIDLRDIVVFDDDVSAVKSPKDSPIKHGGRVIMTPDATGINSKHILRARKLFNLA